MRSIHPSLLSPAAFTPTERGYLKYYRIRRAIGEIRILPKYCGGRSKRPGGGLGMRSALSRVIDGVACPQTSTDEHERLLFGVLVMGAGQSLPSQNQPPSKALHVLRVTPSSPASKTDVEPFFDFVVGFQGDALTNNLDAAELEKIVEAHEGRTLNLVVWNSKNQESRGTVFLSPTFVVCDSLPHPGIDHHGSIRAIRSCPNYSI